MNIPFQVSIRRNRVPETLRSSLRTKSSRSSTRRVQFLPFATVLDEYFPPRDIPHHDDEHDVSSFMARQPRPDDGFSFASSPTTPSSPSTFSDETPWQSVQIYDLRSNYARGRIRAESGESRFAGARRLLGYGHHDVAEIFEIHSVPHDLSSAHICPLLLLRHDDLVFGDNRRAILVDIELHSHSEAQGIEIDRYTRLFPSPVTRATLLQMLGIDRYCNMSRNRCLVWHRGQLIPQQRQDLLQLQHGDYLRVALPPFAAPHISTYYAVRACQHGLAPMEIVHQHEINPNPDEFRTDVEAAQEDADDFNGLQVWSACATPASHVDIKLNGTSHTVSGPHLDTESIGTNQDAGRFGGFRPEMIPLRDLFEAHATTAHEEEGPIAFVTTWYIAGSFSHTSEESRVLRLDQHEHLWFQDLVELWRDRIDFTHPIAFDLVQPEPPQHDATWTIGHLVIHQRVHEPFVPSLLTIRFMSDHRTGLNYLAAVLPTPVIGQQIHDLCNLQRFCLDRDCDLQIGMQHHVLDDRLDIRPGTGIIFNIHPPARMQHVGDEQVQSPPWLIVQIPDTEDQFEAVPDLQAESHFTQALFGYWDVHARPGPAHLERLMVITTWCIRGDILRLNSETRSLSLADDFHHWEFSLRRRWLDLLDPDGLVEFTLVNDLVPTDAGLTRFHVIVHQYIPVEERATLVTTYDNGVLQNQPLTTAAVLPAQITRPLFLQALNRQWDCPPLNLQSTCSTWQAGHEITVDEPFDCYHGHTFNLIIQRSMIHAWSDDEDLTDPTASSSVALLQLQAKLHRVPTVPSSSHPRRQTTGAVAQAQWPDGVTIQLAELIPEPSHVTVDFSSVFHFADELKGITTYLHQPWPCDVRAPDVTLAAFSTLCAIDNHVPIAFHFYTDGSKLPTGNIGAAVILIIQSNAGWHYGGCLYKQVHIGNSSYAGENGGLTWALLWAIHLSDLHWHAHGLHDIRFTFNFDSTSAGFLAAGYWRTQVAHEWRVLMRSLAHVLQTRHGLHNLGWNHIKAHSGHPWNEAADSLAKFVAAAESVPHDSAFWETWLSNPPKLLAAQWLWYKELMASHDPRVPMLTNGMLRCTIPDFQKVEPHTSSTCSTTADPKPSPQQNRLAFTIATANVLTLSTSAATRQAMLMQQFRTAHCHIIGLQETRHRHVVGRNNDLYLVLDHPCTADGHDGVQLWISKILPFDDHGTTVRPRDVRLLDSSPTHLAAKLSLRGWSCVILTGRAPHSGRPAHESLAFWTRLTTILHGKASGLPVFFAGDANAHLGSCPTSAVGAHGAVQENQAGQSFHEWMLEHDLFAPSTFTAYHTGPETMTYLSPDGVRESRIDYVALPSYIGFESIESLVSDEIDLSLQRCDHRVALIRCAFAHRSRAPPHVPAKYRPDLDLLNQQLCHETGLHTLHASISTPYWCLNAHDSAEWLATSTWHALQTLTGPRAHWRRKRHISEDTWALVDQKKFLFKQLRALRRSLLFTTMKACFTSWRTCSSTSITSADHAFQVDLQPWLRLHDHAVATTMNNLRCVSALALRRIHEEDVTYYEHLAQQAAHTYTAEGLTGLWKHVRALLPKARQRRQHAPRDIDLAMQHHFSQLEAGHAVSHDDLVSTCLRRNAADQTLRPRSLHIALEELPTLAEIEQLCLAQKTRKAPGPDQLPSELCRNGAVAVAPHLHSVMCKALLHATEPLSYKGGVLCPIFKGKGSPELASGYRGILLANTFAKVTHAWARKRLLPTLQSRRTIGQLGGLPSQQTITGVQIIKLHGAVANKKGISSAVLFIDLRSAFHHMLRELVFSTHNTLLQTTLGHILDEQNFDVKEIWTKLDQLCANPTPDIPPALRRFLHDLHQHTWYQLPQQQEDHLYTHTLRGTRPGSPMADIGFNLMMTDLLKDIHAALLDVQEYCEGATALGTFTPPIAWVDDVAVPLATTSPSALLPLIEHTIGAVHTAFQSRGLTLNLDPGKTELVVMFRGQGAVQYRKQLFVRDTQPTITISTPTHILTVRVVSTYRHLGVKFAMNLDLDAEINARVGAAKQAFHQMKRTIFTNKGIPIAARVALFKSLILTRLLYGCAIWADLSATGFRKVDAMITDCYRQIFGLGFWSTDRCSDHDFYQTNQLVPFRVFLANTRLMYLANVAKYGMTAHKALLLLEHSSGTGWLQELQTDLEWLSSFAPLPFSQPADRSTWLDVWASLRDFSAWKALIGRAVRKHIKQELIAFEVRTYHSAICSELESHGMQLVPQDEPDLPQPSLRCAHCPATFSTSQQLAAHAFRVHGIRAEESYYVQSEICPGCLRNFHTTYRVVQRLRYRPNQCWGRIHGVRLPLEPGHVVLPAHLRGVHRLPAVRQHSGPLRPTLQQRQYRQVRDAIHDLHQEGEPDFAWWEPATQPAVTASGIAAFERCLDCWMQEDDATEESFHNAFFQTFFALPMPEFQAARIFVYWIEHSFHSYLERFDDIDRLALLETAHMSFLSDIHIWHLRLRMTQLQRRRDFLESSSTRAPRPDLRAAAHEPMPRRNRQHCIHSDYSLMKHDEIQRRAWRMLQRPRRVPSPEQGPFYVIHMYSGRRRPDDFHSHMQRFLDGGGACGGSITLISIDTAIDPIMDVHSEKLWSFLLSAGRGGAILAMLLGPPCETWSNARFAKLVDAVGNLLHGPRPLRSADRCWGLASLSLRELDQINTGNCLLLRGLWLALPIALRGGAIILEHPAPPHEADRPAIWRTGLVLLMLREGWLFRRHTFRQGHFGAFSAKPTTILHAHCPIVEVLAQRATPMDVNNMEELIGFDAHGCFRTAKAKEYPSALNHCFAEAFWLGICQRLLPSSAAAADDFGVTLASLSSRVDLACQMMPDYQPRG